MSTANEKGGFQATSRIVPGGSPLGAAPGKDCRSHTFDRRR